MAPIDSKSLARIVIMRGCGWDQKDIAKQVECSKSTVSYQLEILEEKTRKEGFDVYWELIAGLAVSWLSKKIRKLEALGL